MLNIRDHANRLTIVDDAAMGDFKHEHGQSLFFDIAKDAIVPYTVAPETCKLVEQRPTKVPGIASGCDAVLQVTVDSALDRLIEPGEITFLQC